MQPIDPSLTVHYFGIKYCREKPPLNYFNKANEWVTENKLSFFKLASQNLNPFFFKALHYPIVQRALQTLIDRYNAYDTQTLDTTVIENDLIKLHHNFNLLIEIVSELKNFDLSLRELSPIPLKPQKKESHEEEFLALELVYEENDASLFEKTFVTPYFSTSFEEIKKEDYKKTLESFLKSLKVDESLIYGKRLDQALAQFKTQNFEIRRGINHDLIENFEESLPSLKSEFKNAVFLKRKKNGPEFNPDDEFLKNISLQLKEKRGKSLISQSQIEALATLQRKIREAKIFAAAQKTLPFLPRLEEERNLVYPLKSYNDSLVAYLKAQEPTPTDTLETLAFQASCIFQIDSHFVPTLSTKIYYNQIGFGEKTHFGWRRFQKDSENIDLVRYDDDSKTVEGSIQFSIEGRDLLARSCNPLETDPLITQEELIEATLSTFLFGMFDAHEKNVFISPQGKILFFDNSRTFPHGDLLIRDGLLIASYRSALLTLPGTFLPLTQKQKEGIREKLTFWKGQIPFFKTLLNRKTSSLPPFWSNTTQVIDALRVRLGRVETALNENSVTLEDLSFANSPSFKLLLLLQIASQADLGSLQTDEATLRQIEIQYLPSTGARDFKRLIQRCREKKLNVEKIYEEIHQPFTALLKKIIEGGFEGDGSNTLLKTLISNSELDLKDTNIPSLTETKGRHEQMVTLVQYIMIKQGFHLYEDQIDYKKIFSKTTKNEESQTHLLNLEIKQLVLEKLVNENLRYIITLPINPQFEASLTLFYPEESIVKEISLDILTDPLRILIKKHALESISFLELKQYCDALPVSLKRLHEDNVTQVHESLPIEIEEKGKKRLMTIIAFN
jgi:hypothetical protein